MYLPTKQRRAEMNRLNHIKRVAADQEKERYESQLRELRRVGVGPEGIPVAREAGVDGLPFVGAYTVRGPRDVVLSGPLLGLSTGPGRTFSSPLAALNWAKGKYGEDRVVLLNHSEELPRWAVLVKNLRR